MKPKKDIYNFSRQLKRYEQALAESEITERNKDLIRDFDRTCFIDGLSKPRRIKLMGSLTILARLLGKDFDQAIGIDWQGDEWPEWQSFLRMKPEESQP